MAFHIKNLADAASSVQAAPDAVHFDALVLGYGGSGVVSGCQVTASAGLTVAIASGVVMVAGAVVSVTGTTKASAAAHATLPRFDTVVVDNAGTVTIQGGTASATPAFPVIPINSVPLASLFIGPAQVTTATAQIDDMRVILLNTNQVGMTTLGNTLGNTGFATNRFVLVGGTNVTLLGSTQSGSMTVTVIGPGAGVVSNAIQDVATATGSGTGLTQFAAHDHAHRGMRAWNVNGIATTFFGDIQFSAGSNITLATGGNSTAGSLQINAGGGVVSNAIQDVGTATGSGTGTSQFAAHDHVHRGLRAWNVNGIASTFFGDVQFSAGANLTLNTGGNSTAGSIQFVGPTAGGGTGSAWAAGADAFLAGDIVSDQQGQSVFWLFPDFKRQNMSASVVDMFLFNNVSSSSNSSYAAALSLHVGYYSRNVSTLSLVSSGSQSYQFSNTSNNSQSVLSRVRRVTIPINLNLTPGEYWVGFMSMTASTNANWITMNNAMFPYQISGNFGVFQGDFLQAFNSTNQLILGLGAAANTNAVPGTIAFSDISGNSIMRSQSVPMMFFRNIPKA